jgi:hypothetical protein
MMRKASSLDRRDSDLEAIVRWRARRLELAGFAPALAAGLARDPRSDVHELLELVDRGCPPELAARILAPLEDLAALNSRRGGRT